MFEKARSPSSSSAFRPVNRCACLQSNSGNSPPFTAERCYTYLPVCTVVREGAHHHLDPSGEKIMVRTDHETRDAMLLVDRLSNCTHASRLTPRLLNHQLDGYGSSCMIYCNYPSDPSTYFGMGMHLLESTPKRSLGERPRATALREGRRAGVGRVLRNRTQSWHIISDCSQARPHVGT